MNSLCQLASEKVARVPAFGTLAEVKIDGFRMLFFPDHEGRPTLWTRNGMPIRGAGHILRRLVEIEGQMGGRWFFDGEWQVDGSLAATKAHAERGWKDGTDRGIFHAFDAVPLSDWRADACALPLYRRKALLGEGIAAIDRRYEWEWEEGSRGRLEGKPCVVLMPERWCADADALASYAREVWSADGEGLMAKDAESLYRRARSTDWQKIKKPEQLRRAA